MWFLFKKSKEYNDPQTCALKYLENQEYNKAIEYLLTQIERSCNNFVLFDLLASSYSAIQDYSNAEKYFKLLLSKPLDEKMHDQIINKLCSVHLQNKKVEKAELLFNTCVYRRRNLSSDMFNIAFNLSNCFFNKKDFKKSLKYLERIVKSKLPENQSSINPIDNYTIQQSALQQLLKIENNEFN